MTPRGGGGRGEKKKQSAMCVEYHEDKPMPTLDKIPCYNNTTRTFGNHGYGHLGFVFRAV